VLLLRPPDAVREAMESLDKKGNLAVAFAAAEINSYFDGHVVPWDRVASGVERFREATRRHYQALFKKLASGQEPHTLFITCSDSRVSPTLITTAEPGELFIHRNVGNIVPPCGADNLPAEGATVEYAVSVLGVKQIIVCAHSGCGAMRAVVEDCLSPELSCLSEWLRDARALRRKLPETVTPDEAARANVLLQVENLRTYPAVRNKIERGELKLSAWFYDISRGEIFEWDLERGDFVPVGDELARRAPAPKKRDTPPGLPVPAPAG
jgi:carbonic anhydrase